VPLPPTYVSEQEDSPDVPDGPAEIGARHILISYKGAMRAAPYIDRTKEQAEMLATELQEKAQSGADFEELARKNSDDPGSASSGGSLGRFARGQMVKEFSDAAFSLPVGGVSEVVESPFGFHVIQRTE
jgi:parvulin-like peptidyl-prolyl isomerase